MNTQNVSNYGWENPAGPNSCNYITPKILKILKFLHVRRIADIGSGNGSLCGVLQKEGYEVVGIEQDAKGFDISNRSYPNIKFYNLGVEGNPNQILNQEDSFDAVVSTEVIEHLYSPHLLPIFAKEFLKKNGYLIVSTPYHGFLKNLALSLLNKWDAHHTPLWHGGHIKFWSKNTLSALFEEHGFRLIYFYGVGRVPFLWKSMILVAIKN
jgi:2-polyprenyl-3-methyl-5-hydroxy-6-metoxy-1,4-benzoquinol methylase